METRIIETAIGLGAVRAGIANLDELLQSPSHRSDPLPLWLGKTGAVLILALAHPPTEPSLDWWDGIQGTPGNRRLARITHALVQQVYADWQITAHDLPYHVEKGGLFLKDAAVLGGLGSIGNNNLLITPDLGPRVRFRAMHLDRVLASTGPVSFAFCEQCPMPCRQACPQNAFASGGYSREACRRQMNLDVENRAVTNDAESGQGSRGVIKYCRRCEFACPVGKD